MTRVTGPAMSNWALVCIILSAKVLTAFVSNFMNCTEGNANIPCIVVPYLSQTIPEETYFHADVHTVVYEDLSMWDDVTV